MPTRPDVDDDGPPVPGPRARLHTRGKHRCGACAITTCVLCGQVTLHRIDGEWVCELRCSPLARIESKWKTEMRRALAKLRRAG